MKRMKHTIHSAFSSPWPWIGFGLVFWVMSAINGGGPVPPLRFADVPLYALMVAGLLAKGGNGFQFMPPRRLAPLAFIVLSWGFGMIYEASLTVDGSGIGGMHPQTRASYILAQGDYIMVAALTCAMVRYFHLDFRSVFFFAGGISLSEGLIFTGVLTAILMSPAFFMAPLFVAYYTLAYASFVALPLLFIAPETLWSTHAPPWRLGLPLLWLTGFVLAFIIRLIWGLGWVPFANWTFNLPPNLEGV